LFNIIAPKIKGSNFLDVCAGSGAVGIEALSRGAAEVTFVERNRQACTVINTNLTGLGITQGATIINREASIALKRLEQDSRWFDIVFFDPPYASGLYDLVMTQLGYGKLLARKSVVIIEHRIKTSPETDYGKLRLFREVKQGESGLTFFEMV